MHSGAAWTCAPRPNAPPASVDRDLVRPARARRARARRGVGVLAAARRTCARIALRRVVVLASTSSSLQPSRCSYVAVARRSPQARRAAALATRFARAASIDLRTRSRGSARAPCLMARAFLMPRPVLMRELVLVLAQRRPRRLVAGLLEELHRALADAADEEEPLALGERLGPRSTRRRCAPGAGAPSSSRRSVLMRCAASAPPTPGIAASSCSLASATSSSARKPRRYMLRAICLGDAVDLLELRRSPPLPSA